MAEMLTQPAKTMAEQIAQAAFAFQKLSTGHEPHSVSVVLGGDTLVVTLHGALTPAEQNLANTEAGAAKVREFHQQLFQAAAETLRADIKKITGMEVLEATANVEPKSGAVVQVFSSGTVVQVFLLSGRLAAHGFETAATTPLTEGLKSH